MMPPIPTPTLQENCLNHLYEHRLLRDVVDRSALSTIFFFQAANMRPILRNVSDFITMKQPTLQSVR